MDKNKNLDVIENDLVKIFKAQKIEVGEFLALNSMLDLDINDNMGFYKIDNLNIIESLISDNEKSEIEITIKHFEKNIKDINPLSYQYKISTGQLIIVVLESDEKENLSSFYIDGNGQKLVDYLSRFISDDIESINNPLDEVINELQNFKPYGKYFK